LCSDEAAAERPLKKGGETRLRLACCVLVAGEIAPKQKTPSVRRREEEVRRELLEPWTIGADFYRSAQDINLRYERASRHTAGRAPQIISSIKSFRKKN
jgi:hypothetical protein